MSTSTGSASSTGSSGVGVAAGVIGAIITVILYWGTIWLLGDGGFTLFSDSGAWITIIISTFITGYVAARMSR